MTGIELLRTLHTKQLLNLKNDCYGDLLGWGYVYDGDIMITYEELKQVLSERPHIPRKPEAKGLRRKSAKSKKRLHQSSK